MFKLRNPRRAVCVAAAAIVLALAYVPEGVLRAFSVTGASFLSQGASYRINPNFTDASAGSASEQIQSVRLAAETWRLEGLSPFHFDYAGTSSISSVAADGTNVVYYSNTDGGGALAVCYWWTSGGFTTNFDIIYYDRDGSFNFVWANNPNSSQFDIRGVGVHEFGHALGLDHSAVSGATMFPSVGAGDLSPRTLAADDIAGVQSIYGVAAAPVPVVSSLSSSSGWIDGGQSIVISGQYFSSGASVTFGSVPATGVVVSNSLSLSCVVPARQVGGPVDVRVTTSAGSGTLSSGYNYLTCRLSGAAALDTWTYIDIKIPADAGRYYQGALSLTNSSFPLNPLGSPPDLRIVPIGYDFLAELSVDYGYLLPGFFWRIQGVLDGTGYGRFAVWLPTTPGAAGLTMYACALTGQIGAPTNVQSITNGISFTFP